MANFKLGKFQYSFLETTTSGGTLILVGSSKQIQVLTGTLNHTVVLPDATTMGNGLSFTIINTSTGTITVNDNGSNLLSKIIAGSIAEFLLTSNGTSNGTWRTYSSGANSNSGIGGKAPSANKTSNYTIVSSDTSGEINCDTSSGSISITLPAPSTGFNITIKDAVGNSSVNPISILRSSSSLTIDNETNDDILHQTFGSISYISDGTNWFRVSNLGQQTAGVGIFAGGTNGTVSSTIDYINMATAVNAANFGNLSIARAGSGSCASFSRGVWGGGDISSTGNSGTDTSVIDYVTIATLGNATSFGSLTLSRSQNTGCGNTTRGVFAGGDTTGGLTSSMEYITIATLGNGTSFGNMTNSRYFLAACSSPTRGIFAGGYNGSDTTLIDYITISTTGNAISFGNLTVARQRVSGCSSETIGIFAGGLSGPSAVIDYITIATTGNATSFGNLSVARSATGACSSTARGFFGGGDSGSISSPTALIDYVTISTTGNATSFSNLSVARTYVTSLSNSHGGL